MIQANEIPNTAVLRQEESGVRWFAEHDEQERTINNYMEFDGRVLAGNWCGPRWVFMALVEIGPEERATYGTHDALMDAINRWIINKFVA